MNLATLTTKLADLSKQLSETDPESEQYDEIEAAIFDLEEEIEEVANLHTKQDFH